jgi:hypothetical protein
MIQLRTFVKLESPREETEKQDELPSKSVYAKPQKQLNVLLSGEGEERLGEEGEEMLKG